MVYVSIVGVAVYVLLRLHLVHGLPGRSSLRGAAWVVAGLALGAGLAAVQVLPTVELARVSERAAGLSLREAAQGVFHGRDLLMFLYPYWNGDPGRDTYGRVYWENCAYIGLLPLLAGLAALPWQRRSRIVPVMTIALLMAALVALGPHTPLFALARKALPGFASLRFPQRFLLWGILALCTLSAVTLTALLTRVRGWPRTAIIALAVGLTLLDLCWLQRRQVPMISTAEWTPPPASALVLSQQAGGLRIYTMQPEMSFVTARRLARGWEGDLSPYLKQRALLQPDSNALYGLSSPAGYTDLTPALPAQVWGSSLHRGLASRLQVISAGITLRPALQHLLDAWSVGHVLSVVPLRGGNLIEVGRDGWALIYANPTALPRARLAFATNLVPGGDRGIHEVLAKGNWDAEREVLVTSGPELSGPGPQEGRARITAEEPTRVVIATEAAGPAYLVLADTWYPGWRATVDGAPAPIHRANLCQRGVYLPAGKHAVVFRYLPTTYQRGLVVSLGALVLWLAALIVAYRRGGRER
jgi:hypothetical protein